MAKVGSAAFVNALNDYGIAPWHGHWLSGKWPEAEFPTLTYGIPDALQAGSLKPTTVIVPVREPGARAVAAFFQQLGRFGRPTDAYELFRILNMEFDPTYPDRWFERELKHNFGFDALHTTFEPPYTIYKHNTHTIMIIRLEDADVYFPDATEELFGIRIPMHRHNTTLYRYNRKKKLLAAYKQVIATPMTEVFLDKCYGMEYAWHFYSQEELQDYRRRWENGAN